MIQQFNLPAYDEPFRFTKAVFTQFEPIYIPIDFYDSTGGPFRTNSMDGWLEIYDQNGIMGQCPCSSELVRVVLPFLMTGETKTYREWYDLVYWGNRNRGFSSEAAVELGRLDIALHDIMAKRAGVPLHKLFGAKRDWVKVYASGCGTGLTRQQMIQEVEGFLKDGYMVFKMKAATRFGSELDKDIERVALVREMIGPDCELAVDVNQLWDAEHALSFAKRIEPYRIAWYEEPVHSHDMEELAKLTKVCPIDVSMGESMRNKYLFPTYVECGAKHLQPIPTNLCGVRDWMYVRDLAKEHGLTFSSGGFSHLTASFVATCDEDAMVEYLYPILRYVWEIMELRPEERDGKFYLPDVPGIPLSPDWKLIDSRNLIASRQYFYPQA